MSSYVEKTMGVMSASFYKNVCIPRYCMKCPELHINVMLGNTIPMEWGLKGQVMKHISMQCTELHESHVS